MLYEQLFLPCESFLWLLRVPGQKAISYLGSNIKNVIYFFSKHFPVRLMCVRYILWVIYWLLQEKNSKWRPTMFWKNQSKMNIHLYILSKEDDNLL